MNTNPRPETDEQRRARNGGYNHGEAFCLMKYRDTAGNEEVIWNSRDGITPFMLRSREGFESQHIDWKADRRAPHHVPKVGDRIFIDLTLERARAYRTEYVERYWDDPEQPMREHGAHETKEEWIEALAKADYESFGAGTTPDIVEVTEEMHEEFLRRAGVGTDGGNLALHVRNICQLLAQHTYNTTSELELQAGIATVLAAGGVPFEPEVVIADDCRIDFVAYGEIGIEVKVDGAPTEIIRQLARYASTKKLRAILLLTTRMKHVLRVPNEVQGVRIFKSVLGGGLR